MQSKLMRRAGNTSPHCNNMLKRHRVQEGMLGVESLYERESARRSNRVGEPKGPVKQI
jgi:hypothetical protein